MKKKLNFDFFVTKFVLFKIRKTYQFKLLGDFRLEIFIYRQ